MADVSESPPSNSPQHRNFLCHCTMPGGASYLFGLLNCTNPRRILTNKPQTITFDAEIFLGNDAKGKGIIVMSAILHHYVQKGLDDPEGDRLYLTTAKVASITPTTDVGDGEDVADYDVVLESISVGTNFVMQYFNNLSSASTDASCPQNDTGH